MSDSLSQPLNQSLKESVEPNSVVGKGKKYHAQQQVMTESMVTTDRQAQQKLVKRYQIFTYVGACCCVFGLILFLILPPFLHSQIVSQAIDKSILSQDNQDLWAHFPGSTQTIITRNFSFFQLMNDEQVLLRSAKPKFKEIEGYIITQKQDYLNISYSQDGNKVSMTDWLHFDVHQDSKNLQDQLKIINIPSMGYWYTLKNSKQSQVFLQGFSLLFITIQDTIIDTVLAQGISSQFLSDQQTAYTNLLTPAGLSPQNKIFVYEDKNYGVGDQDNIKYWIQASRQSFVQPNFGFSPLAIDLKDYFTLEDEQLYFILAQFRNYITTIDKLIIKNHYCDGIKKCTGRQLAIRQISSAYVTKNVPPVGDVQPVDTICMTNRTCTGYFPQIYAYYENVYKKQHPQQNITVHFDIDIMRNIFDYNPSNEPDQYNKAQNALFHVGNLDALFNNGTLYDQAKDQTVKDQYLKNIKQRFKLESNIHAKVFWSWIKYIMSDFLRQTTKGNQVLGIASAFSQSIYESFINLQNNLQPFLLKQMIKQNLRGTNCLQLLTISLETKNIQLINKVCSYFDNNILSDKFIYSGIRACKNKYQYQWQQWLKLGVSELQIQSFCDSQVQNGFGQLYKSVRIDLNNRYKCDKTPVNYCSDYQLALKQWANSTITLNVPESITHKYKPTLTFSDWYPQSQAFQYTYYANKVPEKHFHTFTMDEIFHLFNFDGIFGATQILSMFRSKDTEQNFKDYIRYVVIYVAFGGFTRARKASQFIFGYNDENLLKIKNTYPPYGGDPSVPAYVAFNDLNQTAQEANLKLQWYTGKDDISMVAQYSKINGLKYLTNNYTYFNGNQSYWLLQSPWKGKDYFYGTSGKQFAPDQQTTKNISIYVPNLQRYGSGSSVQSYPYERYGYDLRIAYLGDYIFKNKYDYPDNEKYYQEYFAVFNQTSVLGFPLFITKHHFMNCSSNWTDLLEIYNQDLSIKYQNASHWDDSFVIVEPFSGLAFQAVIYLQSNYFYEPDQLFRYNKTMMMPVFSIFRSGNVTQDEANTLFAPLKVATILKSVFFYVGLILSIISLILTFFAWTQKNKLAKQYSHKHKNKQLDISLQRQKLNRSQSQKSFESPQKLLVQKKQSFEQQLDKNQKQEQKSDNYQNNQVEESEQKRESIPISDQ